MGLLPTDNQTISLLKKIYRFVLYELEEMILGAAGIACDFYEIVKSVGQFLARLFKDAGKL